MSKLKAAMILALPMYCAIAVQAQGGVISMRCTNESGMSVYDLELNLNYRNGEIRYRFMGQDVFYSVTLENISDKLVSGVATWKSSRSGETRGTPFSFEFNRNSKVFTELNMTSKCSD